MIETIAIVLAFGYALYAFVISALELMDETKHKG